MNAAQQLFGPGAPGADYARNPYPALARLGELSPRHYLRERDAWFISGGEDIAALLRDNRLDIMPGSSFSDPSDAFRTTVPGRLRAWFSSSQAIVAQAVVAATGRCILSLLERGEGDLVHALARAIPAQVMATLLGIPPEDVPPLQIVANDMLQAYDLDWEGQPKPAIAASAILGHYFQRHWHTARATPLLALLRDAQAELALPAASMVDTCSKLFTAGTTTTAGCLANILARLAGSVDADASPDPATVDELLRLDAPIIALKRAVREAVPLGDVILAPGQTLYLFTAAANRAPAREGERRPPSLTFGLGRYRCLGARLAQLEIAELLDQIRPALPHMRLARPVEWREAWLLHEARSIPVTIHGARHVD